MRRLSTPWRVTAALLILIYSGGAALLAFDFFNPGQLQEWSWRVEQRFTP